MIDLKASYDRAPFLDWLEEFLAEDLHILTKEKDVPITSQFKRIDSAKILAEVPSLELSIFEISHSSFFDPRVEITKEIFRIMTETFKHRAIIAIKNESSSTWRLSLMTINLDIDSKGKIQQKSSNPRRYSYILGPEAKIATPTQFLINKGRVKDFDDLKSRFSVEVVNDEFYEGIAELYDELAGTEDSKGCIVYPNEGDELHEFAVRLIGRIIFCWFLREKRSSSNKPLIPHEILSEKAAEKDNYYHSVLAPLFFEVLNKPAEKRSDKYLENDFGTIPYLNGGLFSNDEIDLYEYDKRLDTSVSGKVDVPDAWLKKLFALLERFNFTVDENTSFDNDLSIDPEMLGRVFENLLARINPETGETVRNLTGSFYTPRHIVEFMVDSSLVEYLDSKTDIGRAKLEALVSYDLLDDSGNELTDEERVTVLELLSTLTVLDPACGSGAFPIGVLQKIVHIISVIDPNAKWWLDRQLAGASPEVKKEFQNKGIDYIRKLGIIRQTIFGVDIQSIATEISRLRCFLTLIVDEEVNDNSDDNRGIRPLPNLEFKFVTANSLFRMPEQRFKTGQIQQDMFDSGQQQRINSLKSLIDEYFISTQSEKIEIKAEYRYIQNQLWGDMHKTSAYGQQSLALTVWDPFTYQQTDWFDPSWMLGVEGGFDIVIGNPPYFVYEGYHKDEIPALREYDEFKPAFVGKINAYKLFIVKSIMLVKNNGGIVSLIFQNSFLGDKSAKLVRKHVLDETFVRRIDSFPERDSARLRVFEGVKMSVCILLASKQAHESEIDSRLYVWKDRDMQTLKNRSTFNREEIVSLDPELFTIPSASTQEKKVAVKILKNVKGRFKDSFICYQGEINLSTYKKQLTQLKSDGMLKVLRGAEVLKFRITDKPSQGEFLYIDPDKINMNGKKSRHYLGERIVMQGITGVNEKYRIKASALSSGIFCGHSCNYLIAKGSKKYSSKLIIGILNSNLINWLFSINSTNSNVNSYEIDNLPLPITIDPERINRVEKIVEKLEKITDESSQKELMINLNKEIFSIYDVDSFDSNIINQSI